jgi:ubiquitin conjugation factor E4 B
LIPAAQELSLEQHSSSVFMNKDNLDRIIVSRLIESPPEQYPQSPFQYLLGCFSRAVTELRSLSSKQDATAQQQLQGTIVACKDLLLSYSALILSGSGVVPEVSSHLFNKPTGVSGNVFLTGFML